MTKWALVFITLMFATGNSFPIYFTDQIFRSLEQLDEALDNGEISQEYYDDALIEFVGPSSIDSPIRDDVRTKVSGGSVQRSFPEWYYRANYRQGLEDDFAATRYDRFALRGTKYGGSVSLEKRHQHSQLVRDFMFLAWGARWRLEFGSVNPQYASDLTVGQSSLHRELHSSDDFGSSLLYPTQHRKNGVAFSREFRSSSLSAFASRTKGDRYYDQSLGGDFTLTRGNVLLGLVSLRQEVGKSGANSRSMYYAAPHAQIGNAYRNLTSESSFQIGGAMAHFINYEINTKQFTQSYSAFSYGSTYQNLESGGYAYSDYDDATLDDVGLEYREKRTGRRGVAIEQTFNVSAERLSAQLVRWENRLDDRQCVAGRLTFEQLKRFRLLNSLRLQAIYQDLDIARGTDMRKLITISTELQPTASLIFENQQKIEQRILAGSRKYPFRSRHDFAWRINSNLESTATINYYNGDLSSNGNAQLTLALGQEIKTGRDFRFSTRFQTRYKVATERLDNWELRINLEVVL